MASDAQVAYLEQRIRELTDALNERADGLCVGAWKELAEFTGEARDRALEEAAVRCDELSDEAHTKDRYDASYAYEGAATAIRALKGRA
jgi:predicted amidophosphoribosyltransferase